MDRRVIGNAVDWLRGAHRRFRQTEQFYMVVVALFLGLGGGLGAVAFRKLSMLSAS